MDDQRTGAVFRALRRRRGWRQIDLAERAGVSQQVVSLLEQGHVESVGLGRSRAVAAALGAKLELAPRWRGPELDRLLDARHAAIVGQVVGVLRDRGWSVVVEWTFSHYGERGAVDVLGWHAASACLLVIEVKSELVDLQGLIASVDRKARIASELLRRERGWYPRAVSRIVVLLGTTAIRDALRRHGAIFDVALPARSLAIRRWVAAPDGSLAGVWLLRPTTGRGDMRRIRTATPRRVRRPRSS